MDMTLFGILGRFFFPALALFEEAGEGGGGQGGQGGEGGQGGGSGGAGAGGQGGEGGGGQQPEFKIPDEYKDKGWAKKVKSQEDLYRQIDALDSAVGKKEVKPTIDHTKATPEEISKFYEGRAPKDANDYTFGKEGDDEGVVTGMKTAFQKAHLDDYQAGILSEAFREYEEDNKAKAFDPDDYDAMLEKSFGKDFKTVAGKASNELKQHMNAEERDFFDKAFPNKHADFVLKIVNRMMTKYGVTEGHLTQGGGGEGGGAGGAQTIEKIEARQSEIRKEMRALVKAPHSVEQKQRLQQELNDLTTKKMALAGGKK